MKTNSIQTLTASRFANSSYFSFVLLLGLALTIPGPASEAGVPQTNIRETCRKRVSGMYLTTYDKNERAKRIMQVTTERSQALKKSLIAAEAKLKKLELKANNAKFDMSLNTKVDQTSTLVKRFKSALIDQKALKSSSKADFESSKIVLVDLKSKITTVFNFVKVTNSAGYDFSLAYKDKCTKYRYVCPLPRKSRELLLKIFKEGKTPGSCQKYSGHFR